jgi:CubicO group peptidase (beta-lactamase class C family)
MKVNLNTIIPAAIGRNLIVLLIVVTLVSSGIISVSGQTGIPVPEMAQSDVLVKNFLAKYDLPGATMALAKDGKIVYMRAFGYADINKTIPTKPYNLLRIASLSKQITSVAIMKMMQDGKLSMSSKVFGQGGILQDHPVFSVANITDARIYDITVQNLLEHSAGWNRDLDCNPDPTTPYPYFLGGCDPIIFPLRVTQLTGTANPVSEEALVKFLLEKGLDFAPGTAFNYSNIGYIVLGKVIEKISGKSYEDYVRDNILAPLGIFDMHIANNLLSEKQEREGEYSGWNSTILSCYGDGAEVPWEYGGLNIRAMSAHGGWITTAADLLKLTLAVDGFSTKPDILSPATIATMTTPSANVAYYAKGWEVNGNNWFHNGLLPGTASEQVRAGNGYAWVIILNKDSGDPNFWGDLDQLGWNCIASTSSWPAFDLMECPTVNASGITFSNVTGSSIKLSWTKGNGEYRMVVAHANSIIDAFPDDRANYTGNAAFGTGASLGSGNYVVYNGTENSVTVTGLTPGKTYYFRVFEYNKNTTTGNNSLYLRGNNPQSSQATFDISTEIAAASFCRTSSIAIPFTAIGVYGAGNSFTAQLSNASGSFASPVNVGTLSATGSGTINTTIPSNTPAGSGYRIRVVSSNPSVTGSDNGSDINITATCPCQNAISLKTTNITSDGVTLSWTALANQVQWKIEYKKITTGSKWTAIIVPGNLRSTNLSLLIANQRYQWHISTKCGKTWTSFSDVTMFKTLLQQASSVVAQQSLQLKNIPEDKLPDVKLYPNPSKGQFVIELHLSNNINTNAKIELVNMMGKTVSKETANINNGVLHKTVSISSSLASGIYIVKVVANNKTYMAKLIYEK